ncbi:hypothetical protein KAFR_0B01560 [Kazachstania africana CBS 2517]|uniref:GPI transamidase component GPI16 n=1 Tax=Kazachstania africana (strain ATCC 22294 / BCRC 22015 / CBS 2517 / CECT 1963 / NBRC 1671 / NRRL Y-8276) TaxID=1071382 RepID=H2AQ05_KAZAF|nr:hypothetical protein KAFR_0B01560 [Kazachstania africana CBS 2517]CCF56455.1 hypothetical protein KAFR_0B01560 [Kazachstania africana CBS 2517]
MKYSRSLTGLCQYILLSLVFLKQLNAEASQFSEDESTYGGDTTFPYKENMHIKPLPRNHLMMSFSFNMTSESFVPGKSASNFDQYSHYYAFPKAIEPLLHHTSTRKLNLRFTRGFWNSKQWGRLPNDGFMSGSSGVELWAVIEAASKEDAYKQWKSLANSLSGLFCASINFIDSSKTTYPVHSFQPDEVTGGELPLFQDKNDLYLIRAALANEPVCTENLTPLVKLLPTKGKAGISSLLDGHKVFDSLWHNLAIDVNTRCDDTDGGKCHFEMEALVNMAIHVPNVLHRNENPIPRPLRGEELRCDESKTHDEYHCFPSSEESKAQYLFSKIFGKTIRGSKAMVLHVSNICVDVSDKWTALIKVNDGYFSTSDNCFDLNEESEYDLFLSTEDTNDILPVEDVPVYVSRSLTGSGQDYGGLRAVFNNPTSEPVKIIYFESLPWFMRIYLSTLTLDGKDIDNSNLPDIIKSTNYTPSIDRNRPTQLEFILTIPAYTSFSLSYQFDKALLHFSEYLPDANHGFEIESAVITVIHPVSYQFRTSTLLLSIATPDFSMPYNVIIITSTVMGLIFGMLFNMFVKRMMTLEEADKILVTRTLKYKLNVLRQKILSKFQKLTKKD